MRRNGASSTATVLSALVAKQVDSDVIQLDMSRRGIRVFVNGEEMVVNARSKVPAWNVVISRADHEQKYMIHFSCGIHIVVERELNCPSVTVSIPKSFMNRTMGLLGYYNGDKMDDLLPGHGLDPLPLDSNLVDLHESFGVYCKCSDIENSSLVVDRVLGHVVPINYILWPTFYKQHCRQTLSIWQLFFFFFFFF